MSALFLSLVLKISHVLEARKGNSPEKIMQQIADDIKTLAASEDDPGALAAYEKAIGAMPNDARPSCALGETLISRMGDEVKNLKRGALTLEKCVKLMPAHLTAWKTLGDAYKALNRKKDAIRCYKQHLLVAPDDVENPNVEDSLIELGGKR